MGRGRPSAQHGRSIGFHGHNLHLGAVRLEGFAHTAHGAARTDAGHEDIDAAFGVVPHFFAGGGGVHGGVGGVDKLAEGDCAVDGGAQRFGTRQGAFHAFGTGREFKAGTVGRHEAAALHTHGFGHNDHHGIAFHGGGKGQTHAGVTARGFDDRAAGAQNAVALGRFDHGQGGSVFDGTGGIVTLEFHEQTRTE